MLPVKLMACKAIVKFIWLVENSIGNTVGVKKNSNVPNRGKLTQLFMFLVNDSQRVHIASSAGMCAT